MTDLTKTIKRVSNGYMYYRGEARPVIIGIEPPQIITLRLKGCKRTYKLTADELYWMAAKAAVREADKEKAKKRKQKKLRRKGAK